MGVGQLSRRISAVPVGLWPLSRNAKNRSTHEKGERRVTEEILDEDERGQKLTDREERMLAYLPYGTAARVWDEDASLL